MALLDKTGITTGQTVTAAHVSNIYDALNENGSYTVQASGSFSGSFEGNGSQLTGISAEWDGTHNGDAQITGSLVLSGSGTPDLNVYGTITSTSHISSSTGNVFANRAFFTGYTDTPQITNNSGTNISFSSKDLNTIGNITSSGTITSIGNISSSAGGLYGTSLHLSGAGAVQLLSANKLDLFHNTHLYCNAHLTASKFHGDGSGILNLQRPITSSGTHITASAVNAGYYFRTGGNITCSIQLNTTMSISIGAEYEFFQTASVGNLIFVTQSGITFNSKSNNKKLAGQFSGATLKKVGTDEWDLIGDLG